MKDFIRFRKDESRCGRIFGLSNHFTLHIFPYEYGQFAAIVHSKEKNCAHFSSKIKGVLQTRKFKCPVQVIRMGMQLALIQHGHFGQSQRLC